MRKYKMICTLDLGDVVVQTLLWLLLSIVTLGLAVPFFVYYFVRLIINRTEIQEIAS